jgi:hypothetical protein
MKRVVGILSVVILVLSGCGRESGEESGVEKPEASDAQKFAPTSTTAAGGQDPSGSPAGTPDPCTLLTDAEVVDLTGRQITQIDTDGADENAISRYCQWQQAFGRLGLFLVRQGKSSFDFDKSDSPSIPGIGDDAYWKDGHLFVLVNGTITMDVFVSGGDESANQAEAEKIAQALVPKVRAFA